MEETKAAKRKTVEALGCTSAAQSLLVLPKGFVDKRVAHKTISTGPVNQPCLWKARIRSLRKVDKNGNPTQSPFPAQLLIEVIFACGTVVPCKVFGSPQVQSWKALDAGDIVCFTASLQQMRVGWALFGIERAEATGRVHPIYVGQAGRVSGEVIEQTVEQAVADSEQIKEVAALIASNEVVKAHVAKYGLTPLTLLKGLHRPDTPQIGRLALVAARMATIAEIKWQARSGARKRGRPTVNIDLALIAAVREQPETLSAGQRHALNEIRRGVNLTTSARMLLNGDVGSGKTLVFMLAAASVARALGQRVAVMVPSEIVAGQIYAQALKRFPDLNPVLLAGGSNAKLEDSKMVIGTQSLLHCAEMGSLALLVVDEQHKFSVAERSALVGPDTHVIEASATPIPRSLALALFDGWSEAKIAGYPVDKKINCHLILDSQRVTATALVRKHLINGKRIVFLYPQVESRAGSPKSVTAIAAMLEERFPGKVVRLHGKMKQKDKAAALADFAAGSKPIAVSSTVIEVGVDIADICCMVVSGADRFGVAQLHQLRGRLVRNGGSGDFVMMTDKEPNSSTRERLEAVRDVLDGFELAERDMHMRGFGEVLGDMQSGSGETLFKLARLDVADFLAPEAQQVNVYPKPAGRTSQKKTPAHP